MWRTLCRKCHWVGCEGVVRARNGWSWQACGKLGARVPNRGHFRQHDALGLGMVWRVRHLYVPNFFSKEQPGSPRPDGGQSGGLWGQRDYRERGAEALLSKKEKMS